MQRRVRARIDERTNDDRRELVLARIAASEVAVNEPQSAAFWSECKRAGALRRIFFSNLLHRATSSLNIRARCEVWYRS
jgi:hypothetical protein